jgi:plasmid stabilization system protein ParE
MDYTLVWSEEALDDVDALADYIARDSVFYAQQVVDAILTLGDSLTTQPARGRVVPELNDPAIRELFVYSYRMLYEIREVEREIHLLAVLHGKRLLSSLERFQEDGKS